MRYFTAREAMTNAELPEPLTLQHSEFIIFKQILQRIVGPAARHSVYSVYSVDCKHWCLLAFIRGFKFSFNHNLFHYMNTVNWRIICKEVY